MHQISTIESAINTLIESLPGEAGVWAQSTCGSQEIAIHPDAVFPTASSVKMFVFFAALHMADRRQISLSERIILDKQLAQPGSGVLYYLDDGLKPSVGDLAKLMMMISDNTATNVLIDYIGVGTINQIISEIPLENTRTGSWGHFKSDERESLSLGSSTPREMGEFLLRMRAGELLSESLTEYFWNVLRIQKYIDPLRRHLPADPWAREWEKPEPVWVASKPGHLIDCTTETGLIHAHGKEWVLSVMTKDVPLEELDTDPAEELVSEVSRLIFEAWSPQP